MIRLEDIENDNDLMLLAAPQVLVEEFTKVSNRVKALENLGSI